MCSSFQRFGKWNDKILKSVILLFCMLAIFIAIQTSFLTDEFKQSINILANPITSLKSEIGPYHKKAGSEKGILHMNKKVELEKGLLHTDKKVEFEEGPLRMDKKVEFEEGPLRMDKKVEFEEGLLHMDKTVVKRLRRFGYSSPLVVPAYNLILFWNEKAACTFWKALCQQIQNISSKYVHDPERNGLKTLRHYNDSEIISMMNNKSWTKAAFVREPRARFLSAYLEKMKTNQSRARGVGCWKQNLTFEKFVVWAKQCHDVHWETQVRMPKYLYKTTMVGRMENLNQFAEMLLKHIGAFSTETQKWLQKYNISHPTNATNKIRQYYTPELERKVIKMYEQDFEVFNFSKKSLLT